MTNIIEVGQALYVVNKEAKKERDANQALFAKYVEGDDKLSVIISDKSWDMVLDGGYGYDKALKHLCMLYSEYYNGVTCFDSTKEAVSAYMTFIEDDIVDFEGCWEWSEGDLEDAVEEYLEEEAEAIKENFFAQLKESKRRRLALYALKNDVLDSLGTVVAIHVHEETGKAYKLMTLGNNVFHRPTKDVPVGEATKTISGQNSSEVVGLDMSIDEALAILEGHGFHVMEAK